MLETRKNITLSGNSYIEKKDETSGVTQRVNIVYLSASISEDGSNISVNKTIQDKAAYLANKKTCDLEMTEFEKMAFDLVK